MRALTGFVVGLIAVTVGLICPCAGIGASRVPIPRSNEPEMAEAKTEFRFNPFQSPLISF